MSFRKALTTNEILSILEEDNDLLEANEIDAVYIPPPTDCLTDEEDLDDNEMVAFNNDVPADIVGTYELYTDLPEQSDELTDITTAKTAKKKKPNKRTVINWKKENPTYSKFPCNEECTMTDKLKAEVESKSPYEVFALYFTDDIWQTIVNYTKKYAIDNNRHSFTLSVCELKRFIGILFLSGYHTLPAWKMYWSKDEDKNVQIVRDCMSRNKFFSIKQNIHLCDNDILDKNDKFAKLRPFFELINEKNMQFGIFSHNVSIDEEMVPYFGRHGCKMFIRGKPVRFGFKLWCLCSSNGYLYKFIPYAGKDCNNLNRNELGLGEKIVVDLLSVVTDPSKHRVFFDNFFSSHKLFCLLTEKGFFGTGTIRENRTNNKTLEAVKSLEKKPRGSHDFSFDNMNEVLLVRWNDNAVVTVATNNGQIDPLSMTKRYDRKQRKMINIPQPQVIADYNKNMGGVDLHDNGIANYRIKIRGKKWWWPLFINTLDSVLVNSWKIYNIANGTNMSQLEFKSYVATTLMKMEQVDITANVNIEKPKSNYGRPTKSALPSEIQYDKVGHVIMQHEEKIRRRCRNCKSQTIYMCTKCKVHLHPDCFKIFHLE